MKLQQLEYIVAVDTWRHFSTAAEKCNITQPTLSMMIQRLEEELDVKYLTERAACSYTVHCSKVIEQARIILSEASQMKNLVRDQKGEAHGQLHIGIIPTVALTCCHYF